MPRSLSAAAAAALTQHAWCLVAGCGSTVSDHTSLLQLNTTVPGALPTGLMGMSFVHVPFNFGNTVEMVAMFPKKATRRKKWEQYTRDMDGDDAPVPVRAMSWEGARKYMEPGSVAWGHLLPELTAASGFTGCPLYLTPQKYWPAELAGRYFGGRDRVGILRDPYEKLVAQFRGSFAGYGGMANDTEACRVNHAIKQKMRSLLKDGNMFADGCTFVPQAEYFDMPHGITHPIDNFRFPDSMNEYFKLHSYPVHIETDDILHVTHCDDKWAGDLDMETRRLVQRFYARDFELLCKHFGYCDKTQNTCIARSPEMCPDKLFAWDKGKRVYCPRKDVPYTSTTRINPACQSG